MFGSTEIIVIVLVVFLLFGASAIPKFAKSLGQAKKSFEEGIEGLDTDADSKKKKDKAKKPS
jgi:sec-independent protein translocase protein TatA